MEAVGELAPNQAPRLGRLSGAPSESAPLGRTLRAVPPDGRFGVDSSSQPESDGGGSSDLARCLELLKSIGSTAVDDAALLSFREAADFADQVEEISRAADYLQVVAAGAVERSRREAAVAARSAAVGSGAAGAGWVTGWGAETADADHEVPPLPNPTNSDPADDGSRNATEFLRTRLRISAAEARRRIALASALLPRNGFAGNTEPAVRPELAAAVAAGTIASRPATIITMALDRVRHHATGDATARMEHALTRSAAEYDTDFLTRVARRWTDAIDQDGSEPSEEELCRRQGVFLRPVRRGLQHIEIFATPDQYEPLLTVMNTATNPRTRMVDGTNAAPGDALDLRTRPQRLLDGLVGACKASLTTGALPAAGGLKPQVMVTVDYRDLLDRLDHTTAQGPRYRSTATGTSSESPASTGRLPGTGSFTFTGHVPASTVRKIACDADIIPVLLGSQGRILDIGRTTRIFPPHIRKAITARDGGCAFPVHHPRPLVRSPPHHLLVTRRQHEH